MPSGFQYRVDGGAPVDVGQEMEVLVEDLPVAPSWSFEVRAYDENGNFSAWSPVAVASFNLTQSDVYVGADRVVVGADPVVVIS